MSIKNKDGSTYSYNKINPIISEQDFWSKTETITMHNKFGQRLIQQSTDDLEIDLSKIKIIKEEVEEIKIIQTIEEPKKPKHISEGVIEVWCLPCVKYSENEDPLYGSEYAAIEYGNKFVFRARLLEVEDLYIQIVTDTEIPEYSVIYPKTSSRRWWKIHEVKQINGFYFMICGISDYQPSFD